MAKKIKLYQVRSDDGLTIFWTSQKPFIKGEKLLKARMFSLPLKWGFYDRDYLSPTDVEFIKKEKLSKVL